MPRYEIVLGQGEWWVDRQLRRHRIAAMDVNHAANTAAMLRRGAHRHPFTVLSAIHAELDKGGEYERLTLPVPDLTSAEEIAALARRWIETTPLMRALRHRASLRGPTWPFHWVPEAL